MARLLMAELAGDDLLDDIDRQLTALQRERMAGRPVIVVAAVLAGATRRIEQLRQLGVTQILVVTFGDGTGDLPPSSVKVVRCSQDEVRDVVDEIAAWTKLWQDPPPNVRAAIDRFDPDHRAIVRSLMPVAGGSFFCERPTYGVRSGRQQALEDKTLSLQMWQAAGVPHAPEEVVPCDWTSLQDSVARLEQRPGSAHGTVWSADASLGMNGGGRRVFRVVDDASAHAAFDALSGCSERVRVMPFLDGVPCSIHGIVTPAGVLVLRPVELVMLRPFDDQRFLQAGISSWWDPADQVRAQMRTTARAVGQMLARDHDYRGAFGIDGIVTSEGFRPNELNPRYSGGINTLGKGIAFPLQSFDVAIRVGEHLSFDVEDLERALLASVDEHRFGSAHAATPHVRRSDTMTVFVSGGPDELTPTSDEGSASGLLEIGPASAGSLVRFTPLSLAPGGRLAPWALAAYRLADRLWDTGFGPMTAAPDVFEPDRS